MKKRSEPAHAGLQHSLQHGKAKRSSPWLAKYRFKKGVSGNPSGKRKGTVSLTAALKNFLAGGTRVERLVEAIYTAALAGDATLVRVLLDRIDGPLGGPLAVAIAQAQAATAPQNAGTVNFYLPRKDSFDRDGEALEGANPLSKEKLRSLLAFAEHQAGISKPPPEPQTPPPSSQALSEKAAPGLNASEVSADTEVETEKAAREPEARDPEPTPELMGVQPGVDFIVDPLAPMKPRPVKRWSGKVSAKEFLA